MTIGAKCFFQCRNDASVCHFEGDWSDRNLVPADCVDVCTVVFAVSYQLSCHPVVFFSSRVNTFFVFI